MSWKSTKRRKSTAALTSIAMLAATCAAIVSFASPASAGTGSNGYALSCDASIGGTPIGVIPTPVIVTSLSITPDPGLPVGEAINVQGDVTVVGLGALQAGLIAAAIPGNIGLGAGSTVDIGATNSSTAPIAIDISGPSLPMSGRGFTADVTTGSPTITSADAAFVPGDVGLAFGTSALDLLIAGAFPQSATIGAVSGDGLSATIHNLGVPVGSLLTATGSAAVANDVLLSSGLIDLGTFTSAGTDGSLMEFSLAGGELFMDFGFLAGNPFTPCTVPAVGDPLALPGFGDLPFGSAALTAPIGPPTCSNSNVSVGLGQPVDVDLVALCVDQNGDLDPTSFVVTPGSANGTVSVDAAGLATYVSVSDPGPGGDTFTFTVDDLGLNGPSVAATISVGVLANLCDATAGDCSLTQIVTFNVIGAQKTMEQTGQFVALTDITLNGVAQVATGSLNDIEVLNARGDAAGWTVSAYSTDYGTPGAPTTPTPAGPVYDCSPDNTLIGGAGVADRLCIPGSNMGWAPTAAITHLQIPGDVAAVNAGPASAVDAAAWLTQLETGSNAGGLTGYLGGAPGAAPLGQTELCSAPVNQSGGTFACDADLFLGVPASAGAGAYNGAIILTLS